MKTRLLYRIRSCLVAILIGVVGGCWLVNWRPSEPEVAAHSPFQATSVGLHLAQPEVEELVDSPQVIRRSQQETLWRLFYATNRQVEENSSRRLKLGDRADNLRFGVATVEIPATHRRGEQEPPKRWTPFHPQTLRKGISVRTSRLVEESVMLRGLQSTLMRMPNPEVLVIVHGYNVTHSEALTRTCQIAHDLPFLGAVIAFTWPSAGRLDGYFADSNNAADSVDEFEQFLAFVKASVPDETKINILAHSMGNRVVLGGLERHQSLAENTIEGAVSNLILAAPDVGHSQFEAQLRAIGSLANRVTLYTSIRDGALVLSHAINGEARAGLLYAAPIAAMLDTIDVSSVDTDLIGHSYYGSSEAILNDLYFLIRQARKPEVSPWFRFRWNGDAAGYWAFAREPPPFWQ